MVGSGMRRTGLVCEGVTLRPALRINLRCPIRPFRHRLTQTSCGAVRYGELTLQEEGASYFRPRRASTPVTEDTPHLHRSLFRGAGLEDRRGAGEWLPEQGSNLRQFD